MLPKRLQFGRLLPRLLLATTFILAPAAAPVALRARQAAAAPQGTDSNQPAEQAAPKTEPANIAVPLPKGKKLILTDGNFQIVREYQREGDHVRYYSLERSAWEEIPADLVDWDATQKAEAEQSSKDQELVRKLKAADLAVLTADIEADTSFEVRPGILLPDKAGVYALSGGRIITIPESLAVAHMSKSREAERIATGIPLIPQKYNLEIPGKQAKIRVETKDLEFYFRTADGKAPAIDLLRTVPQGDKRKLESVSSNVVGQISSKGNQVRLQIWDAANGLYRFTVEQTLTPGEYALVEKTPEDNVSLYIWDFGVDAAPRGEEISTPPSRTKKQKP